MYLTRMVNKSEGFIQPYFSQSRKLDRVKLHIDGSVLRSLAITFTLVGSLLPSVSGFSFAAVGLVISLIFAAVDITAYFPKLHPVLVSVFALFTLLSCSLLWTDLPSEYGVEKIFKFITITLLSSLVAVTVRSNREISSLAAIWPSVMLPVAVVSLLSFEGGRAEGFESNPIWVGRALSTGLIFLAWRLWFGSSRPRLLPTILTLSLLSAALIATGSRGPLLGLLAGLLILVLFGRKGRVVRISALGLGAAVAGYFTFFTGYFANSRLVESLTGGDLGLDTGRSELYSSAIEAIIEHPEGVGMGNLHDYWPSHFNYPHNIFLEVMAEQGVVVGVVFMMITALTLVRLLREARHEASALLFAAILAAEIINVSLSGDLNARSFFFFLILSIWILHRSKRSAVYNKNTGRANRRHFVSQGV